MTALTGRRRFRSTEHGLILEVEESYWNLFSWSCRWRIADTNDVCGFELVTD